MSAKIPSSGPTNSFIRSAPIGLVLTGGDNDDTAINQLRQLHNNQPAATTPTQQSTGSDGAYTTINQQQRRLHN
jgi:hypothetical protein